MSLRIFHVIFIVSAIVLSALGAAWGIRQYVDTGSGNGLAVGVAFLLAALALVVYAVRVFKKLKELP